MTDRTPELEARIAELEEELRFYKTDLGRRILTLTAGRILARLESEEELTSGWIEAARKFLSDNDLKLRSLEQPSNAAVHQFPFQVLRNGDDHFQAAEATGD